MTFPPVCRAPVPHAGRVRAANCPMCDKLTHGDAGASAIVADPDNCVSSYAYGGEDGMAGRIYGAALLLILALGTASPNANAQSAAPPADAAAIEDLALASRILANEGVLDAYGHVSIRHPGDPNRYLMARSLAPALIGPSDILEFHLDSKTVKPTEQRLFTERFIHGAIYQARPDVKAIVHSHSPTVIPFGISDVPLRPVFHLGAFLYGGVPVFEISDFTKDGEMLARNAAL